MFIICMSFCVHNSGMYVHPVQPWPLCIAQNGPHLAVLCAQSINSLFYTDRLVVVQCIFGRSVNYVMNHASSFSLANRIVAPKAAKH